MKSFEQPQLFSTEQPYSNVGKKKKVAEAFLSLHTQPKVGVGGKVEVVSYVCAKF